MKNKRANVREMALIAVMAAVICILGPISLPIGIIPVSITNLAIFLVVYVLGWKQGTLSYLIYLLLGLVGMPVFSGFTGGVGKLLGPTGGYLIGFLFMALIAGWMIEHFCGKVIPSVAGMIVGMAVCYLFGTVWLAWQAQMTFAAAFAAGVLPFLVGDMVKIGIAAFFGVRLRRQLICAGIIDGSKK